MMPRKSHRMGRSHQRHFQRSPAGSGWKGKPTPRRPSQSTASRTASPLTFGGGTASLSSDCTHQAAFRGLHCPCGFPRGREHTSQANRKGEPTQKAHVNYPAEMLPHRPLGARSQPEGSYKRGRENRLMTHRSDTWQSLGAPSADKEATALIHLFNPGLV